MKAVDYYTTALDYHTLILAFDMLEDGK